MSEPVCCWDHNPDAKECGRPAKWMINAPHGYWVCGIHLRSAQAIGENHVTAKDDVWSLMCGMWRNGRRCRNVAAYPHPKYRDMCASCSLRMARRVLDDNAVVVWAMQRVGLIPPGPSPTKETTSE